MTNRTELEDGAMEWIQTMLNSDMEPEFKEIIEDVETEDVSDVEGVYALARHLAFYNEARPVPPQAAGFVLWAFRLAIQEENGEAMLNLGVLYYTGRLGEQDFAKAVKYYKMAYAHGEWFACQNLGYCYYYGRSVEVDYARAYHYFVKTALKGFTESLYKLGDMYAKGLYVEQDRQLAYTLYQRAYDEMDETCDVFADVCLRLANAYYDGVGTKRDWSLALRYYQMAESSFYDQIAAGDFFKKKVLRGVIEKIDLIRQYYNEELEL